MKNDKIITTKDIFEGMKAEYLKQGWIEHSDKEIHKEVKSGRLLIIRLDGCCIDMRLSRSGNFTSRHNNDHSESEHPLRSTISDFMNQFNSTAKGWIAELPNS